MDESDSTGGIGGRLRKFFAKSKERPTEDAILEMVDLGEESGSIDSSEKEWIQNVFDFDDISVRRIMTKRKDVEALPLDASVDDVLQLIEDTGLSRFPAYGEDLDDIKGILYARDFLLDVARHRNTPLNQLIREAFFVPESIHADKLFAQLQRDKVHIAVIIDEYGSMEGIVTMEDLVEEIVGNIYDEYDPVEEPEIVKLADGDTWNVAGEAAVDDVEEALDIHFETGEEDEYDTIGGLVVSLYQAVPEDGETFEVEGYGCRFKVLSVQDRCINRVLITKLPQPGLSDRSDTPETRLASESPERPLAQSPDGS